MTAIDKETHKIIWPQCKQLSVVWVQAQRPIDEREVERIQNEFDPDVFGTCTISLPNGNDIYHVVDGQTRIAAVRGMWGENERVPCVVVNASTPQKAADIFSKMNTGRVKPQAIDAFKVNVVAERVAETEINTLLVGLGYIVDGGREDGNIGAVGACLIVYNRHNLGVLKNTLLLIQAIWGRSRESVESTIIRGFAEFVTEHSGHFDSTRLVEHVTKKYTAPRLIGAARSAREVIRGSMANNVRLLLEQTYNHGLKKDRLGE